MASSVAILDAFLQHSSIFAYVDIALRAGQQKVSVVTKASIPSDYSFVAPRRRVLLHFLVRHPVEVSAKIDAGLVHSFIGRLLLEVPDWLFHIKWLRYRRMFLGLSLG